MEQPNGNEQLAIASGNSNDAQPPTDTNRNTDVTEKYFMRVDVTVDVTDEFPFLVTKLSPYYDH